MKRRKQNVVWLPPDTTHGIELASNNLSSPTAPAVMSALLTVPVNASPGTYVVGTFPVVGDWANDEGILVNEASGFTLSDLYKSGYRLRRICGQFWAAWINQVDADADAPCNVMVTMAFQVMQTNDNGDPADAEAGIPDIYETTRNPWIFRRSWILTNYAQNPTGPKLGVITTGNAAFNVREGTFFDQKTARTVGRDQRLFMCVQVTPLDGDPVGAAEQQIKFWWNFRMLGSLFKVSASNRHHSSR